MRKSVVAGLSTVALVFAASVAIVVGLERSPEPVAPPGPGPGAGLPAGPPAAGSAAAPSPPTSSPAPRAMAPVVPEPSDRVELVGRAAAPRPSASAQEERRQEGIAPERKAVMASMRQELMAGLELLQRRVARCGATDIAFTLTVESVEGGVSVVDAAAGSPEPGQEAAIACARDAVKGQLLPGQAVEPGKRWQMSFTPAP